MGQIHTLSSPFQKVRAINSSSSGFPARIPTITEPPLSAAAAAATQQAIDCYGDSDGPNTAPHRSLRPRK